ncbi:MAG: hypothetical protein CUN55_15260, partial [Phototrophicales bacterium]
VKYWWAYAKTEASKGNYKEASRQLDINLSNPSSIYMNNAELIGIGLTAEQLERRLQEMLLNQSWGAMQTLCDSFLELVEDVETVQYLNYWKAHACYNRGHYEQSWKLWSGIYQQRYNHDD